jgi:hypothetical protein
MINAEKSGMSSDMAGDDDAAAEPALVVVRGTSDPPVVPAANFARTAMTRALLDNRRLGLTGGGLTLTAAVFVTHAAFPIAVPALLMGGALFCAGFLARPFREVLTSPEQDFDAALKVVNDASERTLERLRLARSWMTELQATLPPLSDGLIPLPERVQRRAAFIQGVLDELTHELSTVQDTVRASIWLRREHELVFMIGSQIENPGRSFSIDASLMGAAFREREIFSVRDAPGHPRFEPTVVAREERFRGLLCVPLFYNEVTLGVLCVDRTTPQHFSGSAEDIVVTLSTVIVLTLSAPLPLLADGTEQIEPVETLASTQSALGE